MWCGQVQEQKGLDMVRRDWCPLSKDVGNFALREILSAKPKEEVVAAIHDHLHKVSSSLSSCIQGTSIESENAFQRISGLGHLQASRRARQCGPPGALQEPSAEAACKPKDWHTNKVWSRAFCRKTLQRFHVIKIVPTWFLHHQPVFKGAFKAVFKAD